MRCMGSRIIAYAFGRRSKTVLRNFLSLLSGFNNTFWYIDNFSAYDILPSGKYIIGKLYTQRIERENLTFRNRIKRLIARPWGTQNQQKCMTKS